MKVLIVYPNRLRMLAPAPLGAALVADRLRRDGHTVRLLDLMFVPAATKAVAEAARQFRPDLVGFSLRNCDNQSAINLYDPLPLTRAVVAAAREAAPGAVTLLGGTAFTTFPTQYLDELSADYGYSGDDLEPMARFVTSLASGRPDLATPGLVYRESPGGAVRANPFAIVGYANTAFACWDLIDFKPYRRALDSYCDAAVLTRTGCPFECVYCDTFRTFGRRWVLRDPNQIADEVLTLRRRHGVRSVYLADAGFNRPLDHAKAVLEALVRVKAGVSLEAVFEPGEIDEEFGTLFRRAGGRTVMLFASSLSDPVLSTQRKPFQYSGILRGVDFLAQVGLPVALMLLLGGPGETRETLAETLRRTTRLRALFTMADRGCRILPGTALHAIAAAEGIIGPDAECFRPIFYHSPQTPPSLLDEAINSITRAQRWNDRRLLPWLLSYTRDKVAAWLH